MRKETIKRIFSKDLSILTARTNEAKTSFLCYLIRTYKQYFKGDIYTFHFNPELNNLLGCKAFFSLKEMEEIRNSIIIVDEVGVLFDLENRKKRKQVDNILRMVNHKGNKIVLSGLSSDFKKFLCAKAKLFMYKTLNISDLINGSLAKTHLTDYKGEELGEYTLQLDKGEVLCFDGVYWIERFPYIKEFDTKLDNKDLFIEKEIKKEIKKEVKKDGDKK